MGSSFCQYLQLPNEVVESTPSIASTPFFPLFLFTNLHNDFGASLVPSAHFATKDFTCQLIICRFCLMTKRTI